jgi:hypothetical protein
MELSNASFLPEPNAIIRGSVTFEWAEGGDFLVVRQGAKGDGMPWATWMIGRDQDATDYTALYFDDRRVSRVYCMSFARSVWKMWRNAPKLSQTFVGMLSESKTTIKANWAKSLDGKKWEHDFDITYRRIET